ncbi:MAG: Eco57I restriction-modification methylase domain-containing protein [Planctomycetes bacterium]|nr:Eco57I restriction-modification methylase domain-containing protein [Planctomycetota bacterium]
MTPAVVASFMASMFGDLGHEVRLLDAGAGVGSLTAAVVHDLLARPRKPKVIEATAYEVDGVMLSGLRQVLDSCEAAARVARVRFVDRVVERDFIEDGASSLDLGLFREGTAPQFNAAILNPPYRKISSHSRERFQLRAAGIETSNLYTAFVGLALRLLAPGGELVAITPRSFCNGPYFRQFRRLLLEEASLLRIHVFESRNRAFRDDAVLQENIIFHVKKAAPRGKVVLSSSAAPGEPVAERTVPHAAVVDPRDPDAFIHLATSSEDAEVAKRMSALSCKLADLGFTVSTGRVVDFRAREFLRDDPVSNTFPLIYPTHFNGGYVAWPKLGGRKANALANEPATRALMVPNETYVLTKRFTSKEERRRVVAVVCDPSRLPSGVAQLGIENHVNYFHASGRGLHKGIARGLAAYLNSSLVDRYFRQFNGHTQVNATDLRSIRYPDLATLKAIGKRIGKAFPDQAGIDAIVDGALA